MPSTKPFVIAYISQEIAEALRRDSVMLTELAAFYRSEGFAGGRFGVPWGIVQPGQVAVVQIQHALQRWPSVLRRPFPAAARPVRQRWLLEPEQHAALHQRASACGRSLSDLVGRMVQPMERRRKHAFDLEELGLQFLPPTWALEVASARARQYRRAKKVDPRERPTHDQGHAHEERWPWRDADASPEVAKRAYRQWVLASHPDRGGDNDRFIRGKEDFERMRVS